MDPILTSVIFGFLFAGGVFLVFYSFDRHRAASDPGSIQEQLKGYGEINAGSLDEIELARPFDERVLKPVFERLGQFIAERTPEKQRVALAAKLSLAGMPGGLSAGGFSAVRIFVAGLGVVLGALLGALLRGDVLGWFLGGAVGLLIGYFVPALWLNSAVADRRKQIQKALPDAMDLLTISSEAGQSFDASMQAVVDKFQNALTDEMGKVIREVQLGRPRLEALDDMGARSGVEDLNNFVQAVIQSEQMGVGIAKILRIQSAELRRRRRQRAQEQAAQASLKMLLPMVGCIFPTLWIILLGPAILVVLKARGG
jgi:tight adherence protein C